MDKRPFDNREKECGGVKNNPSASPARGQKGGDGQMRLPFQPRKKNGDWADWVFRHRIGLLVTIVLYLSLAILFVTYKIVVTPSHQPDIDVEIEQEEIVEEILEKEEQIESMDDVITGPIHNKVSNDDSKYNETLRDSKNSNASEIYEEAERMQRELREGQAKYERELKAIEDNAKKERKKESNIQAKEGGKDQDAFVKGNVTMSFKLDGRTANYIDIPAYMCKGGGQVIVNITVDRNGKVKNARVEQSTSTSDKCLMNEAIASAKKSSFNASMSAPDPQHGYILYTFVAQ